MIALAIEHHVAGGSVLEAACVLKGFTGDEHLKTDELRKFSRFKDKGRPQIGFQVFQVLELDVLLAGCLGLRIRIDLILGLLGKRIESQFRHAQAFAD